MRHERHYTLEQANAVRGWVTERVTWIRDARNQQAYHPVVVALLQIRNSFAPEAAHLAIRQDGL